MPPQSSMPPVPPPPLGSLDLGRLSKEEFDRTRSAITLWRRVGRVMLGRPATDDEVLSAALAQQELGVPSGA